MTGKNILWKSCTTKSNSLDQPAGIAVVGARWQCWQNGNRNEGDRSDWGWVWSEAFQPATVPNKEIPGEKTPEDHFGSCRRSTYDACPKHRNEYPKVRSEYCWYKVGPECSCDGSSTGKDLLIRGFGLAAAAKVISHDGWDTPSFEV